MRKKLIKSKSEGKNEKSKGKMTEKAEFFFFHFQETTETFFGVYQNGIFHWEEAQISPGKNREKLLFPLEKFPCYATEGQVCSGFKNSQILQTKLM